MGPDRSRRHVTAPTFLSTFYSEPPESNESGRPPRVDRDGFLRYRLGWEPILAVEVGILCM